MSTRTKLAVLYHMLESPCITTEDTLTICRHISYYESNIMKRFESFLSSQGE